MSSIYYDLYDRLRETRWHCHHCLNSWYIEGYLYCGVTGENIDLSNMGDNFIHLRACLFWKVQIGHNTKAMIGSLTSDYEPIY